MSMSGAEFWKIGALIDKVMKGSLELPSVQRGFVWKPSQIENLWDSILRGFPSGAIITSKNEDGSFQLLDGQQRTTSIALGFADLESTESGVEVLRSSTCAIRIFIDLRKPDSDKDGKKYVFRVITRSHPWGYQWVDNTRPLETKNKSKAMEQWGNGDPFQDGMLDAAYPWDAFGPLPLNIFTRAALRGASNKDLEGELFFWVKKFSPDIRRENIVNWLDDLKEKEVSLSGKSPQQPHEFYSVAEMYENIKEMVDCYVMPMQVLPKSILSNEGAGNELSSNEINSSSNSDDLDSKDEIEEVFVRLNSAGTVLGGEELNYSIIKAKIGSDLQKKIEDECAGIMKPARFISIAFRLYQKTFNEDSINLRIKPKQFQREMRDHENFARYMREKILDAGALKKVKSLLKHGEAGLDGYKDADKATDYRLPYPLFVKVAATSQGEIMFVLMYRLLYRGDKFKYNTKTHRKMIGMILMFMWNGKDARSRHNKLLEKIWPQVKEYNLESMWGRSMVEAATGEDGLKNFPGNDRFLDSLAERRKKQSIRKDTKIWDKFTYKQDGNDYGLFINNVMCNRDLLMWIQRSFLGMKFFKDELFRLDDTDVPFDWDHISAENFVKNKREVAKPLKDIYQQPCNLRIWPYQLNRADQDGVPAKKFNVVQWKEKFKKSIPGNDDAQRNEYLLENSFCTADWVKFDESWLHGRKIDEKWKYVYLLIINRWRAMYNELANQFFLNELAR